MKKLLLTLPLLLLFSFNQPTQAYAGVFVNFGWHDHHSRAVVRLPVRTTPVIVNRTTYYYSDDGVYYSGTPNNYIIVEPPVGAIVTRLPQGREKIWINGRNYFRYHGVYYVHIHGGFQVVQTPQVVMVQPAAPVVVAPQQQIVKINIPNFNGGYSMIKLTRSGSGFIGPQGEYYETCPTVDQLRVIYAR